MRESRIFIAVIFFFLSAMSGLFFRSDKEVIKFKAIATDLREMTSALKLTDMSFSTDARYTRHPSQADLFSAFQDCPGSIEHFPSGSVVLPPDFSSLETRITVVKK